jgi:hypothetical protein
MRLRDITEARYAPTTRQYSDWVKRELARNTQFQEYGLEDLDEVRQAVGDLTSVFGKPDLHDKEMKYEYWGWELHTHDHTYALYVNTSPELFIERIVDPAMRPTADPL